MPGPLTSGTQSHPVVSLWPALGVSPRFHDAKGPGGPHQVIAPWKVGGRGSSTGGTSTYLGPWGSREPWLAWHPIIPLRREQERLQPSDMHTLVGPLRWQLATSPALSSTPVCSWHEHWAAPPSPLRPLSPAPISPGPAQNTPQQLGAEGMDGQVKEREFVFQSTITV